MKAVGIIVEYNPLHNGHVYHIKKIKELANPDIIIAVMSSSITMRGDISLFNKFEKTKQALELGVNLVIELPMTLAMHKADIFAKNAIAFLQLLKVNEIWIGSEENCLKKYEECYEALKQNQKDIYNRFKTGISYKKATSSVYPLLSNDILGYSYYKAIKDMHLSIQLKTIKRMQSNFLDKKPTNETYTSALSIRKDLSLLENYTPKYVFQNKDLILKEEKIFSFLKYKIISTSIENLKKLFFVDEGMENKLKEIKDYTSLEEFILYLTSKRYTSTRIKRMLMYILFNITKDEMNHILKAPIDFIRVLGFDEKGKKYLSVLKKEIKIFTNIKEGLSPSLDIEMRLSKTLDVIFDLNLLNQEQKAPIYKP